MSGLHEFVTVLTHAFTTRNNQIQKGNNAPDALLIKALPLVLQNNFSDSQVPLQSLDGCR